MAEIKFSADKAERWLDRVEKRLATLTQEDATLYAELRATVKAGGKLDSRQAKALLVLGKKL